MSIYAESAEFYDLLYEWKDYAAEAELLSKAIRARRPEARTVLDVACGTGEHAKELVRLGYEVDGVDLEPAFIEVASAKVPTGLYSQADMTDFHLGRRYDVVTCLFSAIGYVRTTKGLTRAVACMAEHLEPEGLLIIEPLFAPGIMTDQWLSTLLGEAPGLHVARMSRTVLTGDVSRLEIEYLIGRADGMERRSEVHELGLFSEEQMTAAFVDAGLEVTLVPESLRHRGLYIGNRPAGG